MEPYQFSKPLRRWDGEKSEKRSQKTILNEFKATYAENFSWIWLIAQFWLDVYETW